ncbi:hypothetical protein M404DRAFT_1007638 [Pisolithus tinctorius Marx 270]|uniref:Uncharacterized protein n=1 Tax=Pisolithus tinctorius Marx 270 TaxID=870435 RepID=A0A0C3IE89_PISTI|nr:hypothetical protein M404DRAFT_1007638 [Pisolithus tinctorius Marx 270]
MTFSEIDLKRDITIKWGWVWKNFLQGLRPYVSGLCNASIWRGTERPSDGVTSFSLWCLKDELMPQTSVGQ